MINKSWKNFFYTSLFLSFLSVITGAYTSDEKISNFGSHLLVISIGAYLICLAIEEATKKIIEAIKATEAKDKIIENAAPKNQ